MKILTVLLFTALAATGCGGKDEKGNPTVDTVKEDNKPVPEVPKACEHYCDQLCDGSYSTDRYALGKKIFFVCECETP